MRTEPMTTAHSLFVLYETLPEETQEAFLRELMQRQQDKLESLALGLACQQAKDENEFLSEDEAEAFLVHTA